jgi:hypothetical protein
MLLEEFEVQDVGRDHWRFVCFPAKSFPINVREPRMLFDLPNRVRSLLRFFCQEKSQEVT